MPGFTLVLRSLGRWPLLDRALHSVLRQDLNLLEGIIVLVPADILPQMKAWFMGFSGRLPVTPQFLSDSAHSPARLLVEVINSLPSDAAVAFLDDDDYWPDRYLEEISRQFRPDRCLVAKARMVEERLTQDWQIREDWEVPSVALEGIGLADFWQDRTQPLSCWSGPAKVWVDILRAVPFSLNLAHGQQSKVIGHAGLALQVATLAAIQGLVTPIAGDAVPVSRRTNCDGFVPYGNRARGKLAQICTALLAEFLNASAMPDGPAAARAAQVLVSVASAYASSPGKQDAEDQSVPAASAVSRVTPEDATNSDTWLMRALSAVDPKRNARGAQKDKSAKPGKNFQPGFKRIGLVSPSGLQREAVQKVMAQKKRMTLDVFDTTIARRLARPTDVFFEVGRRVLPLPGVACPSHFWALRIAAERAARTACFHKHGHHEIVFEDIFRQLADWCGWDAATTARVQQAELACEDAFLYPIRALGKILHDARRAGLEVWFISDMYHRGETIRQWLTSRGIEFHGLDVSCDHAAHKSDGSLFRKLSQEKAWSFGDQLHIGDNPVADVSAPQALGIQAFHFRDLTRQRPLIDQVHVPAHDDTDLAYSLAVGLTREFRRSHDIVPGVDKSQWMMRQLGYEIGGVLAMGFAHWLAQRAVSSGLRHLFFLSRDGWLFQQVMEQVIQKWNLPLETHYMHGSRRIFDRARLADWKDADLRALCYLLPGATLRDWLARLGLTWDVVAKDATACGFEAPDTVLVSPAFQPCWPDLEQRLRALLERLRPRLESAAQAQQATISRYITQCGLRSCDGAIVDLGWSGSSAQIFQRQIKAIEGPSAQLHAYYFGSWESARKATAEGALLESWFFSQMPYVPCKTLRPPTARHEIVQESIPLLEMLFSATTPSTIGLQDGPDQKVVPEFAEAEFSPAELALLDTFHSGALQFTEDFLHHMPQPPTDMRLDTYVEFALKRFLSLPSPEEAALFATFIPREEHIVGTPTRTLCSVPPAQPGVDRAAQLYAAQEACMWKKAFRTQLDESEHRLLPDHLG